MRPIRLAVPIVAGVLLLAGCGGSDSPDPAQGNPGQGGGPGAIFGGENLTKLADALGVSESKLQDALQSIMPQGGPGNGNGGPPPGAGDGQPPTGTPPAGAQPPDGTPPNGAGRGQFAGRLAQQLADKLGLSEEKVTKALQSVLPQRPPAASPSSQGPDA